MWRNLWKYYRAMRIISNPVPVKKELQRVIRKNVKSLLALNHKGVKVTFTDINKLQKLFEK
jgi:uncharacterized alkaline shock family protein YloU